MKPDLYWIPGPWRGKLAIATRPRGGDWLEDEVTGWQRAGLDLVVSLLEEEEAAQLELADEGANTESKGVRFISFPMPDRGVPASTPATLSLLKNVAEALDEGKTVAVHCRQGLGRSGLIAAGLLVVSGIPAEKAIEVVTRARGQSVPETPEQVLWIRQLPAERLAVTS